MNVVPLPDLALDGDRAVELLDDPLRDREAEAETAALGRDEVVEDRAQPLGAECRSRCRSTLISTRSPTRAVAIDHAAARAASPEWRW